MLNSENFKNSIKIQINFVVHTFSNFFFKNGIGFTQKHYQKAILDLQEVKCPRAIEIQIILFTKSPSSSYVTIHFIDAICNYDLIIIKKITRFESQVHFPKPVSRSSTINFPLGQGPRVYS